MAVAKNEKTGKWYAKFRYHDYTGRTIQKKKEGFDKRSDAQKWEMDFIAQHEGKENISFSDAYKKYMTDCEKRLKVLSVQEKQRMLKYYKPLHNIPISEITPAMIREWQNEYLLRTDQKTGKMALAVGTIHHINTMLSTFFGWCKRFYNISRNPVQDAGALSHKSIAEKATNIKQIWQKKDFEKYISTLKRADLRLIVSIMFWTGLRRGEALGLRVKDIDLKNGIIKVRQNRLPGERLDTPKTKSSIRDVTIPDLLKGELGMYIKHIYKAEANTLIFEHLLPDTLSNLFAYNLRKCPGVPQIRLHDLRHSHASMLINAGFSPDVIADRLGHKNASMVLQIYGHMYPQKRAEVKNALDEIINT